MSIPGIATLGGLVCLDDPGGIPLVFSGWVPGGRFCALGFVCFFLPCLRSFSCLLSSILFHSHLVLLLLFFFVLCTWFCLLSTLLSPFLAFFCSLLFLSPLVSLLFSFLFFALQGWGLDIPIPFLSSREGYPGHEQT